MGGSHCRTFRITGADGGTSQGKMAEKMPELLRGGAETEIQQHPLRTPRLHGVGSLVLEAGGYPDTVALTCPPSPPVAAAPALPVGPPTHSQRWGGCPAPQLPGARPTGFCNRHQATGWGPAGGSHEDLRLSQRLDLLTAPLLQAQQAENPQNPGAAGHKGARQERREERRKGGRQSRSQGQTHTQPGTGPPSSSHAWTPQDIKPGQNFYFPLYQFELRLLFLKSKEPGLIACPQGMGAENPHFCRQEIPMDAKITHEWETRKGT